MIKKIVFSLIMGIIITVFFAQYDPWTHHKIIEWAQGVARYTLGCTISCDVQSVNFFFPSITITDVVVKSLQEGDWSWSCKRATMRMPWLPLLFKGIFERHVVMEDFTCVSQMKNGRMLIDDHIAALMADPGLPIPVILKSVVFKHAHCSLYEDQQLLVSLFFNSSSEAIGDYMKTALSLYKGDILYNGVIYAHGIVADLSLVTWFVEQKVLYKLYGSGVCELTHMHNESTCYITGSCQSGRARLAIRNAYNSFVIDPIIITEQEIRAHSRVPLRYIAHCIKQSVDEYSITGDAHCYIKVSKNDSGNIDGHVIVEECSVDRHRICDSAKIIFTRRGNQWKTKAMIVRDYQECEGMGEWDEQTQRGKCIVHNRTQLSSGYAPYWYIAPQQALVHCLFEQGLCNGIYRCGVDNGLHKKSHIVQGGFSYEQSIARLTGLLDDTEGEVVVSCFPTVCLEHCAYMTHDKKQLLSFEKTEGDVQGIKGMISFAFVRGFIKTFFHYDIQGEGILSLNGLVGSDKSHCDVSLIDATIRLPETYNFIDGFHAHCMYDAVDRRCVCDDIMLSLYTGVLSCPRMTALFDGHGALTFLHAPISIDHCLLNSKKDLFAIVSGNIVLSKRNQERASIIGSVIIDRAQLKENIFSTVIQKQLFDYTQSAFSLADIALDCDITIETKSPIKVDTDFLQTNAHVTMHVKKDKEEPHVSGIVTLQSGELIFPYKPLFINKGVLTFSSEELFDPVIELIARNKIKKYDVSLQVAGTLHKHHIMLDANPPLSEEQIMTLLLVGSEESSLNSMIPTIIVQNLKNLIFVNNQSTFFDKYFTPLLRQFNINLMPSFADQSGRGGLRGMLEVSFDDRWRATIQKNFDLTEDTRFELEYFLSDDITLRAIRDERRDLGGEMEMKWKF